MLECADHTANVPWIRARALYGMRCKTGEARAALDFLAMTSHAQAREIRPDLFRLNGYHSTGERDRAIRALHDAGFDWHDAARLIIRDRGEANGVAAALVTKERRQRQRLPPTGAAWS